MANYERLKLSASTNGRGIIVAATATPGTLIHTALADTSNTIWDEVYLWANNTSAAAVLLTIEGGGTGLSDRDILTIPPQGGKVLVMAGENFNSGVQIAAFAATASVIGIRGFVNRVTN